MTNIFFKGHSVLQTYVVDQWDDIFVNEDIPIAYLQAMKIL